MNLPATAVLFLDAFTNLINENKESSNDANDAACKKWPDPLVIATHEEDGTTTDSAPRNCSTNRLSKGIASAWYPVL